MILMMDNRAKDLVDEKGAHAAAEEEMAAAEGYLAVTVKELADAEAVLSTAQETCIQVATDHGATVAGRAGELEAIATAKEILLDISAGTVVQPSMTTRTDLANAEVVDIIKRSRQADLQDTTAVMEEDKNFLADLTSTCRTKASDFTSHQRLRAEEPEALEKAIEIMESGAVSRDTDKHLPSLLQTRPAPWPSSAWTGAARRRCAWRSTSRTRASISTAGCSRPSPCTSRTTRSIHRALLVGSLHQSRGNLIGPRTLLRRVLPGRRAEDGLGSSVE